MVRFVFCGSLALLSLSGCSSEGSGGVRASGGGLALEATGASSNVGGADGSGSSPNLAAGATGGLGHSTGGIVGVNDTLALTARAWRLTHEQYERSVFELLGEYPDLENFAPESGNGKFSNFASTAFVQVDLAANYFRVAQSLALGLSVEKLDSLTNCKLEAACRNEFITELGERAFRAEVPMEVHQRLGAVFDLAEAEEGSEFAFRAVVIAILNSPLFLYRKEIGPSADTTSQDFSLTGDQIAEFLSYSLIGGPPPPWLQEQADDLVLSDDALESAIAQLMEEPAFQQQLHRFLSQWLEVHHFELVEKNPAVYPGFEEVKPLLEEELFNFFSQSAKLDQGFGNLLLDPVPSVSPALDAFYYSDPSAPSSSERVGVLGLGTVLSSHAKTYLTSPTLRGTFVRARFFCTDITLPEGFFPPPLSETEEQGVARSTRELYERHQSLPTCAKCHDLTDDIGFALESFDGVGRFRTRDTTQGDDVPVDTISELTNSDVDRPLSGPGDLSRALSESPQVKKCFAQQAFRFYFGQLESTVELPAIEMGDSDLTNNDRLGSLIQGLLATTNTTLRRRHEDN